MKKNSLLFTMLMLGPIASAHGATFPQQADRNRRAVEPRRRRRFIVSPAR